MDLESLTRRATASKSLESGTHCSLLLTNTDCPPITADNWNGHLGNIKITVSPVPWWLPDYDFNDVSQQQMIYFVAILHQPHSVLSILAAETYYNLQDGQVKMSIYCLLPCCQIVNSERSIFCLEKVKPKWSSLRLWLWSKVFSSGRKIKTGCQRAIYAYHCLF